MASMGQDYKVVQMWKIKIITILILIFITCSIGAQDISKSCVMASRESQGASARSYACIDIENNVSGQNYCVQFASATQGFLSAYRKSNVSCQELGFGGNSAHSPYGEVFSCAVYRVPGAILCATDLVNRLRAIVGF